MRLNSSWSSERVGDNWHFHQLKGSDVMKHRGAKSSEGHRLSDSLRDSVLDQRLL